MNETMAAAPPHSGRARNALVILSLVIAIAALAVAFIRPGPMGSAGPAGPQGTQGQQGPAGQDGAPAPALPYQCQQLFPDGSNSNVETTFYWPCTNKAQ